MNISYDILSVNTTVSREYSSRSIAFWIILSGTGHLVSDSGKSFEIKPLDFSFSFHQF
ncbi:mannose-6-phosphate isomerase-like protein (cupin superfamily) [Catenibacillus scindens]|uniref:Mannose-6-phosphate isomerase-like protein (Cupin superfamily) n=1 Tax=Catenibacillus scindens TaxID=673271 RepID=A0A7W8M518_9FIRM|nr:hypothetical protein [Catenibacillus scindens]MBB5264610.1 mannose-6-phosphate isomerase-like protein (cupin superfamily) [Catenibacillus scindens]